MIRKFNPPEIRAPIGSYTHGVSVPAGARTLHISGQIGVRPDGTVGATFREQCEIAYDNLLAILAADGMGPADLVKVTVFITPHGDIPVSREVRAAKLGDVKPASTLVVVAGLAGPQYLFEVEATAAEA
jgi:enamine deaminase RidA (YjgF/YER057c/UK114 family)